MDPVPPTLSDRQVSILEKIEDEGFVTIEQLAQEFAVSAQTVRRDIIALDGRGLLQRFHGGAGTSRGGEQLRLGRNSKALIDVAAKRKVARRVAAHIPDGTALYIDVGTTMEFVAAELNAGKKLSIFTNSMRVAAAMDHERHDVRVLPGRVTGRDGSLTGDTIVLSLSELALDVALIGCSAIDKFGRVMDFDYDKIAVKKAAMRASSRSFLLATESKFGRSARYEVSHLNNFAQVFTGRAEDPLSPQKASSQISA